VVPVFAACLLMVAASPRAAAQSTPTATPAPLRVIVIGPLPVIAPHQAQRPVPIRVIAPVPSPGDLGGITETAPPVPAGPAPVNLPPVATLPLPIQSAPVADSLLPLAILAVLAGILMGATLLLSRRRL
jgi:hypothetical protein